MSFQDNIKLLKSDDISTLQLITCLNTIHAQNQLSDSESLLLSSILVNKIIPQAYALLDTQTKNVITQLLLSKIGLSQIIRIIKDIDHQKTNPENPYIFIGILLNILENNIIQLFNNFKNTKKSDIESWFNLLTFKMLDCLGIILIWLLDHPTPVNTSLNIDRSRVISVMDKYISNVAKISIDTEDMPFQRQFIIFCLEKELDSVFDLVITNWNICLKIFATNPTKSPKQKFKETEAQKKFMMSLFSPMNKKVTFNNAHLYQQLINSITKVSPIKDTQNRILNKCANNSNILVSKIWINNLNIKSSYALNQLEKFGNKEYIINTSIIMQESFTKFIILLLSSIPNNSEISSISKNPIFLDTITNRLESKSFVLREFGMFIADYIYNRINGKFMFKIHDYASKRDEFMKQFIIDITDQKLLIDDIIRQIKSTSSDIISSKKENTEIIESAPIMIEMNYDSDKDDSDLEDDSVSRKPTVTKPVFLKDLLNYLTTNPENDKSAYEKREIAFSIGIELVRIKKDSPELVYFATKLIDAVLDVDMIGFPIEKDTGLDDDQIKNAFNSWKISFIIAICTCSESNKIFQYLIESFLSNDWTVPLRIQILTCIGLSCRELSGKEDNFIWGKNSLDKVEPKKLSSLGHSQFLALDNNNNNDKKIIDLENEEREKKLVHALENVGISDGKVVRRSRKLQIDKDNELKDTTNKTKSTTFINKQLPKLFYTLVSVWQEINTLTFGNGFKVGIMSEYLNSHYIDILSMVYSCSIPTCLEIIEMTMEQIAVLTGLLKTIQISTSEFPTLLFKSVINGIRLLINDNDRTLSVLKTTCALELTTLFECYAHVFQNSPPAEESTQLLGSLVLKQLQSYSLVYSN